MYGSKVKISKSLKNRFKIDEDIDGECEGIVDFATTKQIINGHVVYRDAFGNSVVIIDDVRIVAPSIDELEDELARRK